MLLLLLFFFFFFFILFFLLLLLLLSSFYIFIYFFFKTHLGAHFPDRIIASLSKDVSERRTSTESRLFAFMGSVFAQNNWPDRLYKNKTLGNTNLVSVKAYYNWLTWIAHKNLCLSSHIILNCLVLRKGKDILKSWKTSWSKGENQKQGRIMHLCLRRRYCCHYCSTFTCCVSGKRSFYRARTPWKCHF